MIIIKKLTINNFLSHGTTVVEMPAEGKILIDGKSGSGKSTIVEAIVWCLYGIGRVANRQLIRRGAMGASVTLELADVDHFDYQITRTITAKGRHTIEVSRRNFNSADPYTIVTETGVRSIQSFIEREITRASYLLFINSIVYPQDNPETFVRQPAVKRKDLLLEIIGNIRLEEYYDRARQLVIETEKKLIEQKTKKIMLDKAGAAVVARIEPKNDLEKTIIEKKQALVKVDEQLEELEKKHTQHIADQQELAVAKERRRNQAATIEFLHGKIIPLKNELNVIQGINDQEAYNIKKEAISTLCDRKKTLLEKNTQNSAWQEQYLALTNAIPPQVDYPSMLAELNRQYIMVLNSYKDFKLEEEYQCKTCGTPVKIYDLCPQFKMMEAEKNTRLTELEKRLTQISLEQKEYDAKCREIDNKIMALGGMPDPVASHAQELAIVEEKLATLQEDMTMAEKALERSKMLSERLASDQAELDEIDVKLPILDQQIVNLTAQIVTGEAAAVEYNTKKIEKNSIENDLKIATLRYDDVLQAEVEMVKLQSELEETSQKNVIFNQNLELLLMMKEVFSANGLKAMLSDSIIPRFEDRINAILSQLSDFKVKLETQRPGVDAGTVLEGLFINIYNEAGEEFDFDSYSGGEKLKIVVAITEALAEIQKTGFRIIDELFIGLDEESVDNFLKVLKTLQQRFPQLLCISHLRNVKESFDTRLIIEKIKGISKIN